MGEKVLKNSNVIGGCADKEKYHFPPLCCCFCYQHIFEELPNVPYIKISQFNA
jgi:hypothetical protein